MDAAVAEQSSFLNSLLQIEPTGSHGRDKVRSFPPNQTPSQPNRK